MKLLALALTLFSLTISFAQEIIKENLGPNINTSYADTKPLISPDGKTLFFARQFYPENINGEKDAQDIYYSQNLNDVWSKGMNVGAPLNDRYPNGVSSISPDGNKLLVLNAYNDGSVKNGVSIANKDGNNWELPRMVNIKNYYNNSAYVDYFVSNNEQEMLLTIEREDAFGDQDIYVCFRIDETHWTEPVNLGPLVNTQMAEFSPFLAADNKTLFFASEGHGTYGKSDIFYTKRLDDSWQKWSDPINLGPGINTDGFEGYYTIPASGEYAYFVSDNGGIEDSKDIFKANIPYRFLPEPVLLMSGHTIDLSTHTPLEAVILYQAIGNENEKGEAMSEIQDGSFKIILPHGNAYRYYAEVQDFFGIPLLIDEANTTEYHEIESNLYLIPLIKESVAPVFDVYFNNQSDKLLPESSTERAWAVKHYLINNGIESQRLEHIGMGTRSFANEYLKINKNINTHNRIELKIASMDWSLQKEVNSSADTAKKN